MTVRDDLTTPTLIVLTRDHAEGVPVSGKERHCSLLKLDRLFGGDQCISDASWDAADGCAGIDGHVERLRSRPLAKHNGNGEYVWSRELERNYVSSALSGAGDGEQVAARPSTGRTVLATNAKTAANRR